MKKLFLTSGLVLCMACPAFADPIQGIPDANDECVQDVLGVTSGSATLDAIWNPVAYTISFAPGQAGNHTEQGYVSGSTAAITPVTFDDDPFNLTANGFSATGYHFDHWSSTVNLETGTSGSTNYSNQEEISPYRYAGSPTLTAIWAPNTHTITYDAGTHGTGGTTETATYDTPYTALASAAAASVTPANGYTWVGWNTATDQTSGNWTGISTWAAANDVDLTVYAAYTANAYTIAYNCGAPAAGSDSTPSTPTTASQTVYMDGAFTLAAADNCSLPGYTFAGWSCPNLTGTPSLPAGNPQYFAGGATGTYTYYQGSITCTAQWTKNNITLNWNDNESTSGAIAPTSCTYDEGITLPTEPTKTGYTFGGWEVQTQSQNP